MLLTKTLYFVKKKPESTKGADFEKFHNVFSFAQRKEANMRLFLCNNQLQSTTFNLFQSSKK